jgi:hypothetical protein
VKTRRLALTLGTAGGGVLAAALLQPALASADNYDITPDPTATELFTASGGLPPLDQAVSGLQAYNFEDLTTGQTGSFDGLSLNDVYASGLTNQEILELPNNIAVKAEATDLTLAENNTPAPGSFFDTLNYGHGFENVYTDLDGTASGATNTTTDLVGTGSGATNTITDTVVTPFGNFNLPTTFDAIAALQAATFTYPSTSGAFPGYSYVPDPRSPQEINSIGGTLPFDQSVSGTQYYDVDDPTGAQVGNFSGVSFNDVNALGQTNQEILVNPYNFMRDDTLAAGGGGFHTDLANPSAGSLFDTATYAHGFENVYSDVAATVNTPQTITDTVVTPFGDVNVPTTFDAALALPAAEFTGPTGTALADFSYVPDSEYQERVTSISGQALVNQTVSGTQTYDVHSPAGVTVGEFDGVSTHQVDAFGFSNQEIQVTDDAGMQQYDAGAPEPDIASAGSTAVPASGSFFDTFSAFGYENVYSDVVTNGATNTITDTLVTPFGDFNIPVSFSATDALTAAEYLFPAGSTAVDAATALNPADFGAEIGSLLDLGNLFSF